MGFDEGLRDRRDRWGEGIGWTHAPARPGAGGERTETARQLGFGWISRAQAEVVVAAVDRLPGDPDLRAAAERLLLEQAHQRDATDLAGVGRTVLERLDPDGVDRRDERALEREERAAHHAASCPCARTGSVGSG